MSGNFSFETMINRRNAIRATVRVANGRQVVQLSRWKLTNAGPKRTGLVFEFSDRHCGAVAGILTDVQRALAEAPPLKTRMEG